MTSWLDFEKASSEATKAVNRLHAFARGCRRDHQFRELAVRVPVSGRTVLAEKICASMDLAITA